VSDGRAAAVTRFRLAYADCDPAGIVYYAAWFVAMERLLSGWFLDRGFRFDTMGDEVGATPVTRSTWCDYLAPARAYDEVRVEMSITDVGARSYRLGFTLTREPDEVVVARAGIGCVVVDRGGIPTALPESFRAALEGGRDQP
jgi:acyl-CoA thioester hydrolase